MGRVCFGSGIKLASGDSAGCPRPAEPCCEIVRSSERRGGSFGSAATECGATGRVPVVRGSATSVEIVAHESGAGHNGGAATERRRPGATVGALGKGAEGVRGGQSLRPRPADYHRGGGGADSDHRSRSIEPWEPAARSFDCRCSRRLLRLLQAWRLPRVHLPCGLTCPSSRSRKKVAVR